MAPIHENLGASIFPFFILKITKSYFSKSKGRGG